MNLLAHILVNDFGLERSVVERGVKDTVIYGGSLVTNMLELQLAPEETLLLALGRRYGVPTFDLRELKVVSRATTLVPAELMVRYDVLPLRLHGKTLDLGMVDPRSRVAIAEIAGATGFLVKPFVVLESRLRALLEPLATMAKAPRPEYRERPRRIFASLEETQKAFNAAKTRHEVGDALLGFALRYFARTIVFVHRRELLMSWRHGVRALKGESSERIISPPALESLHLPLNQPSVFRTVVDTGSPVIGPLPPGKVHDFFHEAIGGSAQVAFTAPVKVSSRVVNVLYGDAGGVLPGQAQRANLVLALSAAGDAYERIVRERLTK